MSVASFWSYLCDLLIIHLLSHLPHLLGTIGVVGNRGENEDGWQTHTHTGNWKLIGSSCNTREIYYLWKPHWNFWPKNRLYPLWKIIWGIIKIHKVYYMYFISFKNYIKNISIGGLKTLSIYNLNTATVNQTVRLQKSLSVNS